MSVVQICNRGASKYLGMPRVNNLNEGSPQSEQYELHYNDERRMLLERHWWSFATSRQALAPLAVNDRESEWRGKFDLPAPIIETHWINDPDIARANIMRGADPNADYLIQSGFAYTNISIPWCQFTRDEEQTSLFPQSFKDALSAMVAGACAMALTESTTRAKFAIDDAERLISIAIAEDEQRQPPIIMPGADYIDAREGWGDSMATHIAVGHGARR